MPAIPFRAEVGGANELAAVELHGDMNVAAEAGLEAAWEAVAVLDARVVLLDFTDADYINSTGIALIVRLLAAARRDGREVRACGLTPHYTEIFQITRLSDYMQIFADRAAASAAATAITPGGVR
jgi:anti-anti-sigma factor